MMLNISHHLLAPGIAWRSSIQVQTTLCLASETIWELGCQWSQKPSSSKDYIPLSMQNIYHVSFTGFFFFTKSVWTVWNGLRLEQHRSTSYSIKTHFWTFLTVPTQNEPKYWRIWSCDAGFCQFIQRSSSPSSHWLGLKSDELVIRAYKVNVFMVFHCLCEKVSSWILVYSLHMI